jgi:hypothetical protein
VLVHTLHVEPLYSDVTAQMYVAVITHR